MHISPQSAKQKILIVEDEPMVAYKEATLLKSNGYEVVKAATGEEAVAVFADDPEIKFILMDLDLGEGIDGAEAARRILRKRRIPISFVTAHKEKEYVDRIKSIPNCGYILKSDGEYVLMHAIEQGFKQFREKLERERQFNKKCSICERFPVMTFCLDDERKIHTVNRLADDYLRTVTGKKEDPRGQPIGNGINCVNHTEDVRGCGYGSACRQCELREILLTTIHNGEGVNRALVPMNLQAREGTREKTREVYFRTSACLLSPGEEKMVLLSMNDISDQIELEKNFRIITENITEIITITDTQLHFLYISPSNERLTGYSEEEMKSLSISDLITEESFSRLEELTYTVPGERMESVIIELEHIRKDGTTFWAEEIITTLSDDTGNVCGYLTTTRDINERKKLQNQLRKSEKKFRLLAENARDIISRVSVPDGRIEYMSPALFTMLGYSSDELPDARTFIETVIPEDWKGRMYEKWEDMRNGKIEENIVYPMLHKSGERKWVSQSFVFVTDAKGKLNAIEGIATDITELKENELKLAELERKNRSLLVEINHRISNNLANVEALARVELSVGEKSKEDAIADIISRVQAIHLIHDKLYRTDNLSKVNLPGYISDLAETIHTSFLEQRAPFKLHVDVEEIELPTKMNTPLGVITAELLTNTFKYAEFSTTCDIHLSICREEGEVRYIYRDTGTGLQGKVKTIDDLQEGTGTLLIRELVSGLGGDVSLHTEKGTEFRISFPF